MRAPATLASRSAAIREQLVSALHADLIGPFDPARTDELLPRAPSRWYLTGFLAPEARRVAVLNEDDRPPVEDKEPDEEMAAGTDDATSEPEEQKPKRRMLWPASVGLSLLLPPGVDRVTATIGWADYLPEPEEDLRGNAGDGEHGAGEGRDRGQVGGRDGQRPGPASDDAGQNAARSGSSPARLLWRRIPHAPVSIPIALAGTTARIRVPGSAGPASASTGDGAGDGQSDSLEVEYQLLPAPGLPEGTRALSVFIVNRRRPLDGREADQALVFQVELAVTVDPSHALVAWPKHRGERLDDEDDRTADLQYRGQREWAVGHGISAEPIPDPDPAGRVIGARTVWMPRAVVPLVETRENLGAGVTLGMEALAGLADGAAVRAALTGLADGYGAWIEREAGKGAALTGRRASFARQLADKARRARDRIREGIDLLASDDQVREAFRFANQAMADQAKQRNRSGTSVAPAWRPFQLAFLLLSLPGVADDAHDDRELVELIFFPTGGGKTEAYLGLAAFILILRRLRGTTRPDGGLGVAVLLRYTLRLLTLDQLGRAATLVCALELLRRADPGRLGSVRFSLGLWVGKAATANDVKGMKELLEAYREHPGDAIPCPLTSCPWCQRPLSRASLDVREEGVRFPELRVGCVSTDGTCPFTLAGGDGIPVLFIDELLYRELPGFVIATVDKLAMLPFRGETAALFGRVLARDGRAFVGHMDRPADAARGQALPDGLRPPDLIIQDELHLISGPLGTMVGLYEMAVDGLCARERPDGRPLRPKVIASTATVRRARQQIRALFARPSAVFPPAGIDASDSFFGAHEQGGHGRLYLGVAAPGRAVKAVLLRIYSALLTAAQRAYEQRPDGAELADAYMTLVGYFNSLRELGGMRRLVEDEVRTRCAQVDQRVPEDHDGPSPWFQIRHLHSEPLELTSRESTQRITEAKRRLEQAHGGGAQAVDVTLASNMISVGVDVPRLGLMVVAGQPKTTSEYIQATSRVGRDRNRPGLVVVAFNAYRPRDRSHYEHFQAYHEAFYANVEATSVTPFSIPALERGLAGALVAMTRLGLPALITPAAAGSIRDNLAQRDRVIDQIAERAAICAAVDAAPEAAEKNARDVRTRAGILFDSWNRIVDGGRKGEQPRVYSRFDQGCSKRQALLRTRLEDSGVALDADAARFQAPTSMRDVEAPVSLWLARRSLGKAEQRDAGEQK